jgi:hypothetical protein
MLRIVVNRIHCHRRSTPSRIYLPRVPRLLPAGVETRLYWQDPTRFLSIPISLTSPTRSGRNIHIPFILFDYAYEILRV